MADIWSVINAKGKLVDLDLSYAEEEAFSEDKLINRLCQRLIIEIRNLNHELKDPNYQFSGRIHRNAILTRDAEILKLTAELKKLKEALAEKLKEKTDATQPCLVPSCDVA